MPKRDKQLEKVLDWARRTQKSRDAIAKSEGEAYLRKAHVVDPDGLNHKAKNR